MPPKPKHTAAEVVAAIERNHGYVSQIAADLRVSTKTIYNYRDRWVSVDEAWQAVREARHDLVEGKLDLAIKNDNITAIIFYLKTQCKGRGYVERTEHVESGEAVKLKLSWDDPA